MKKDFQICEREGIKETKIVVGVIKSKLEWIRGLRYERLSIKTQTGKRLVMLVFIISSLVCPKMLFSAFNLVFIHNKRTLTSVDGMTWLLIPRINHSTPGIGVVMHISFIPRYR